MSSSSNRATASVRMNAFGVFHVFAGMDRECVSFQAKPTARACLRAGMAGMESEISGTREAGVVVARIFEGTRVGRTVDSGEGMMLGTLVRSFDLL